MMLARVAWTLAAISCVLVAVDVVVSAQAVSLLSETAIAVHGFPIVHAAAAGSALMGALIISRYEHHPIGWLLCVVGFSGSVSLLAEAYAFWVQEEGGPGSDRLAAVAAWISLLFGGQILIGALALVFLLAPDGRLVSPRWRFVAWAVCGGTALCFLAIASVNPTSVVLMTGEEDAGLVRQVMLSVGFLAIACGVVASVVSMLIRLRRSTGEERSQVRLIAAAAACAAFGLVWLIVAQTLTAEQTYVVSLPLFLAFLVMPVLFAVAVLRHRLYGLDVIINRTLLIGAATAFAVVGYTTLVVAIGQQAGGFWFSLLVTAVVAVAFQPLRRYVVRFANRLAYGPRAQPYEELADFSRRLSSTPSVTELLPAVAAAAGQAVAATAATARLNSHMASWGVDSSGDVHRVDVADGLGSIEVAIPRGRRLRAADKRLLRAIADQAAVAFRNVALEEQLATQVAALDETTLQLARSRGRIVEADDAVRRDLEAAISRDVLPHLHEVSEGLSRGDDIERLLEEVSTGLEALRDLTRGVFPARLARLGLRALPPSVTIDPTLDGRRFTPRVEAAIYFCCTQTEADSAALGPTGLTMYGVTNVPQQVIDRVEAAGGAASLSGDVLTVTVPDLGQPVGPERRLGDVRGRA
jgi:hypothetical protein